ncbi:MAG: hypothetical protein Q9184_007370 [Pyrenodesmia sp. 2 TL-2023]
MKLVLCLAIASTLARRVLARECLPGDTFIDEDTICTCGVFLRNTVENTLKNDFCRSRKCGDVFANCCSAEQVACLEDGISVENSVFLDDYNAALAEVENGDTRIVQYCLNIKCPTDLDRRSTTCLGPCLRETSLLDVANGLDEIATQAEADAVEEKCKDFAIDSLEETECYIDAYTAIDPDKFDIGPGEPVIELIPDLSLP